jgi:3-phosphoshikimate 1-carboxyvinyltransferase
VSRPVPLVGSFRPPGDKSISHRALLLAALSEGTSDITGLNPGADVRTTRRLVAELGADVEERTGGDLRVRGTAARFRPTGAPLDCGNSGTTMRLLAGILAAMPGHFVLTGDESLRSRPMSRVAEPLRRMGAQVRLADGGRAPIEIEGRGLTPPAVPEAVASAQVKSALLFAGRAARGTTTLVERTPSRDHTERMFRAFDLPVHRDGRTLSTFGPRVPEGTGVHVPGDPSAAAFVLAAAALVPGSSVTAAGISVNPTRRTFLDVLARMGARVEETGAKEAHRFEPVADVTVSADELVGTTVEGEESALAIDELPILAVVACFAQGSTVVTGAEELRVKESDRIRGVAGGLARLGADIKEWPDGFRVAGGGPDFRFRAARVESLGDHRLAMAFRIAGLLASGPVEVVGADSMVISDPGFDATLAGLSG